MCHHHLAQNVNSTLTRLCRHGIYHEGNHHIIHQLYVNSSLYFSCAFPGSLNKQKAPLSLSNSFPEPTPEPCALKYLFHNLPNSHHRQQPNISDIPNAISKLNTSRLDTSRLHTLTIPSPLITTRLSHPPHKLRHKPRHTTHHPSPCPLHQHQRLPHTPAQAAQ